MNYKNQPDQRDVSHVWTVFNRLHNSIHFPKSYVSLRLRPHDYKLDRCHAAHFSVMTVYNSIAHVDQVACVCSY
jgi:hypothetical protein